MTGVPVRTTFSRLTLGGACCMLAGTGLLAAWTGCAGEVFFPPPEVNPFHQVFHDYGWTATLYVDMMCSR